MLVSTGCGGCETESSELSVAFEQLAKQGRFSQLRSTTVRIMALFAAVHCFETQNQELVKFRQECFLILKQQLALCMVGTMHIVGSYLLYNCLSANAYPICYRVLPHLRIVPLWPQAQSISTTLASIVQMCVVKQVLLSTLPFSEDQVPHLFHH